MRSSLLSCCVLLLAPGLLACGAGNSYGHGRQYVVASEEEPYFEQAAPLSYEEVRRDPQGFSNQLVGWFGVVKEMKTKDGQAELALELRFHQPRHLCADQFESSCRVTISERTGGPFSATVKLRAEDMSGHGRMSPGSLVKIYGKPTGEFDERGGPVLGTQWYRHWPFGAYVTTGGRVTLRR